MNDIPEFTTKDLKHYPHFDAPLSLREVKSILSDPDRIAKNKFFPFIKYNERWQPYRIDPIKPEKKTRPIRYASRRDAYIFQHYRRILSAEYEKKLQTLGITECPIAYRRIPKPDSNGGKCNIDFANDAFEVVIKLRSCIAIALDIKGYFESLDHDRIKSHWKSLLNTKSLPNDHYAVFKNITKYRFVEQKKLYKSLGYINSHPTGGNSTFDHYTVSYKNMPKQICTPQEFREKVCGKAKGFNSLIERNEDSFGIPQGAPISDLIANFYLIEFDFEMNRYASINGGVYMRYSDDILIILPTGEGIASAAEEMVKKHITTQGKHLKLKESKTCVVEFYEINGEIKYKHIKGPHGKNGLEYLGFRFDGRNVYIRDSTISKLYRKASSSAKTLANLHTLDNLGRPDSVLMQDFNYSRFSERFMKVSRENLSNDYSTWTFYSYAKRSSEIFGDKGRKINKQIRNFDSVMRLRIEEYIEKCVRKRDLFILGYTEIIEGDTYVDSVLLA